MANAYVIKVGDDVSYLAPFVSQQTDIRWKSVKVVAVTDQNNLVLAYVNSDRTRTPINGGVAVPRRVLATDTNVWRPY